MTKTVHIHIDGKEVKAEEGANLLLVARQNGIDIPGLCFHPKLSPTGACRLCVTKIEGMPGLTMACTVQVKDGMRVTAFDEELENNRKHTLDYLLSEHNEESGGQFEDEMADLVQRYGLDDSAKRQFKPLWQSLNYPIDHSSPVLTYDASKCIKCFRCVKACGEVQGKHVLDFKDRGITKYIIAGFGVWKDSECDGCGECVQLCPTGALVEKAYFDTIHLDKIQRKVTTTCPYCGVGCQMDLWIQDEKIIRVHGVEGVSPNDGRLCVKGRFGFDYVSHADRLTHPLIRKNGELARTTWDEALEYIASKLNEIKAKHGSDTLAGYASAKCSNEDNYIFQKMVRIAFGSNHLDYCTRLCHASTVVAMLNAIGSGAGSNSIEDFARTDCLFVIGNNMIETHPVTATFVKQGKARGMKLIVVDPRWTPLVKYADIWLQERLGTDVALLNGLMHVAIRDDLIDHDFIQNKVEGGWEAFESLKELVQKYTPEETERITTVPAETIVQAAHMWAKADTAMMATGMGMSQATVGTNNVFSLLNLNLITGKIGREQCGLNPPRGQNNVQGATDVGVHPVNLPGYLPVTDAGNRERIAELWNVPAESINATPGLSTVEIAKAAHEGRIKGLYIMGENPMVTDPNLNHTEEAFRRLDLLVVQDIFLTETAQLADVVLPASSYAEKDGSVVNSDRRVLRLRKALDSPGEAREDWKILVDVAKRMGHSIGEYENASQIFDEVAKAAPALLGGISFGRIENHGIQWPCPTPDHPGTPTLFLQGFNTPSGKARLNPVEHVEQKERASEEYPFILNSGRILYQYHTATMSRRSPSLNDFANTSYVLMHPDDAVKLSLTDGQSVKVTSRRGTLETTVQLHDGVAVGELFMPWHFAESRVNRLTRDELDPDSKIAPFKYSAVKVEAVG